MAPAWSETPNLPQLPNMPAAIVARVVVIHVRLSSQTIRPITYDLRTRGYTETGGLESRKEDGG